MTSKLRDNYEAPPPSSRRIARREETPAGLRYHAKVRRPPQRLDHSANDPAALAPGPIDPEHALIVAALAGDENARATLVAHLTPVIRVRVTRCLMRYGRRNRRPIAQEVADFTQDVFMFLFAAEARALRAWDTRRGCSLKNFVGLVAQRHVVSVLRGPKSPWRDAPLDPLVDVRAQCERASPEHLTASREELRWLVERLGARLSPQGLEMFYRLCVTQESVAAICGATGLKVASVYQWRRRVTSAVQATLASNSSNR